MRVKIHDFKENSISKQNIKIIIRKKKKSKYKRINLIFMTKDYFKKIKTIKNIKLFIEWLIVYSHLRIKNKKLQALYVIKYSYIKLINVKFA